MANTRTEVTIVHNKSGNYKIKCPECGRIWGDWVGDVPAKYLFQSQTHHDKTYKHFDHENEVMNLQRDWDEGQ